MGKLVVKIICGRNLKGTDMFSDCDGYIKLTLGSKTFRTKAIDNEANPNWNESFSFFVSEAACDKLKLELWDANTFKDDLITEAFVPLNDLIKDTRVLKRVNFPSGKGEVHLELLADFGAPGSGSSQSLSASYSSLPTPYAPQQQQPGQAPAPPQAYANPYGGANAGGYSNPYAQQQQRPPTMNNNPQPQPQYNYPGQNPYGGQNYYGGGAPPPQQQQQRPPQPPSTNGGYPSAASYGQPGQYQNPYAQQQQPHQGGQPSSYQNPYATQYPGSAPSQYSYPGHAAQQQRPPQQQGAPQVGGLGYMPGGNVGGVSYY